MAVRTPVYWNRNSARIEQMLSTEIESLIDQCIFLYANEPSVALNYDGSGSSIGTMKDTRLIAGGYKSDDSDYVSESDTPNVSVTTANWAKIKQRRATITQPDDTSKKTYPLYYNADGNLQAMSYEDMLDTFIHPAISYIAADGDASNDDKKRAGTYKFSSSAAEENHTLVGSIIFSDTRAKKSKYTADKIPEALDQPQTIRNYYLHRRNAETANFQLPMLIRNDDNISVYTTNYLNNILKDLIRYEAASSTSGYKLNYSINGSGVQKGGAVKDTRLNSSTYQKRFVNADDYRTQKFPAGSAYTVSNYYLKLNLI